MALLTLWSGRSTCLVPIPSPMQKVSDPLHLAFLGVSLLVTGLFYTVHRSRRKNPHYPPGSPPDPILGNVRQFPKTEWHNTFMVWQKQYGQTAPSIPYDSRLTEAPSRGHRPYRPDGPAHGDSQPPRGCGGAMVQARAELLGPPATPLCDGNVRTTARATEC